jgi:hypothetical protein
MRSPAKTSILTPRSIKEINNVLNGEAFSSLHGAVVGLDYNLQNATLPTAPDAAYSEKCWGVASADDDSMPTRFFKRFFINRMCVDDAAQQEWPLCHFSILARDLNISQQIKSTGVSLAFPWFPSQYEITGRTEEKSKLTGSKLGNYNQRYPTIVTKSRVKV